MKNSTQPVHTKIETFTFALLLEMNEIHSLNALLDKHINVWDFANRKNKRAERKRVQQTAIKWKVEVEEKTWMSWDLTDTLRSHELLLSYTCTVHTTTTSAIFFWNLSISYFFPFSFSNFFRPRSASAVFDTYISLRSSLHINLVAIEFCVIHAVCSNVITLLRST